jgi:hypothetical protein
MSSLEERARSLFLMQSSSLNQRKSMLKVLESLAVSMSTLVQWKLHLHQKHKDLSNKVGINKVDIRKVDSNRRFINRCLVNGVVVR